jgi:hypothetical protein
MSLPLPDLNRPAFLFNDKARALAAASKCVTCSKDINGVDFTTDIQKREYGISGICAACQNTFFCACGDCEPPNQVDASDIACEFCMDLHLGKVDTTKPLGSITAMHKYFMGSQCYLNGSHCCSLHGKKHMECLDWYDKHEIWQCTECKSTRDFRVREWVLDGGPCHGYSEL